MSLGFRGGGGTLWPRGDQQPSRPERLSVIIINAAPKLRVDLLTPTPYRISKKDSKHLEASKCTEILNLKALSPAEASKTKF